MRSRMAGLGRAGAPLAVLVSLGALVAGCASLSATARPAPAPAPIRADAPLGDDAGLPELAAGASLVAEPRIEPVASPTSPGEPRLLAQQTEAPRSQLFRDDVDEVYDPWEGFNEKTFEFNIKLDRYVLKPVANGYRHVMPEMWQVMVANGFDNIGFVPRVVNSVLQGKFGGAGRELARFLINSTAGIGGLFDPAGDYWGIQPSREDFGQTLGLWGSGPGPYLVLPLLDPMTVRDGIGRGVDAAMDPLFWVLPFIWDRLGMRVGDTVNERALNYELFQGVEETTIDLYSAVRHFYLKRRERMLKE